MFPVYRVNVPLGYAGLPYSESAERARSHESRVSSLLPFVSSRPGVSSFVSTSPNYCYGDGGMLLYDRESVFCGEESFMDKLPFEVRLSIANELSQHDAVSLLRVNKAFFSSTVVRLYHNVVVDPSYSHFNKDVLESDNRKTVDVHGSTFIKMKYSLKNFLKVLAQEVPIQNDSPSDRRLLYSSLIRRLTVVELPDGFHTPFDLNFFTFMTIKKLEHLTKLSWMSEKELPFEVVSRLPNKSHIASLHLNLDFKRITTTTEFDAFKGFTNLQKLSLEPFLSSYNLFQIFKNLLEGNNDVLHLRVLRLARLNSAHGFLKNPSTSHLILTNYLIEHDKIKLSDYELNCLLNLFILFSAAESKLQELKALSMDSMVVTTADARRLDAISNLEELQHLELKNITEVQMPEDVTTAIPLNELYGRLDCGFLKVLGRKLVNLKRLAIDFREGLRDTVPAFIYHLEGLEELDVTIRWNVTKLCSVPSWKLLCHQYTKAILKHASTLKKLSLDTKEDSVFSELHKLIFTECLMELNTLTELESLRLHGYSLQPCAPLLVSYLPKLTYFELFGSGAGGAPHMGLQVVHDGVLDEWLRVQHVAMAINEQNESIKFIKIDKCIFEIKEKRAVVPRDGLESWFESKVRVLLHSDDYD